MYLEENDIDDEEENDYNELSSDIIEEFNYDNKINIINFYKEKLLCEPEFIGIKNISAGKILYIIENLSKDYKLHKKDYKLNNEQYIIFSNMYKDLDCIGNINIFNLVTKKIFSNIYIT